MNRLLAIFGGLAMAVLVATQGLADESSYAPPSDNGGRRSAYSYIRVVTGDVAVTDPYNGRVAAGRNMPISTGDELTLADPARAEVALADGNLLELGGGTRARFESLASQQGEDDTVSVIKLTEGSVILSAMAAGENNIPRIDTDEATIYLGAGAVVRVNADPRHGTSVIARTGNAEVHTPMGSYRVKAGEYLNARSEYEPEVGRGSFSHDRFDIWAEDRLGSFGDTRSASAGYVDSEYANDAASLDGNGDWNYSAEYGGDVWSPNVDAGWSPYSNGSWYYTPAGLTWWSSDPWGWCPFHYGSWFYSSAWNRWCWGPGSVYSPAWVYWGFTPGFVGWCPVGYYSYWSPWYDNYYKRQGWNHPGFSIGIQGTFSTRTVDFRGWNFTGSGNIGTAVSRMGVVSGTRMATRLGGNQIAITSRPIVVPSRAGAARDALQSFVREAPQSIQRSALPGSERLAPVLAHQRTLPEETLAAVGQRAVQTTRNGVAGPGAAEVAPRGVTIDHSRTLPAIAPRASDAGSSSAERLPNRSEVSRPGTDWRTRSFDSRGQAVSPSERPDVRSLDSARPDRGTVSGSTDWRAQSRTGNVDSGTAARREVWRSRQDLPPARRVIEGAVPGRRSFDSPSDGGAHTRTWRDTSPRDSRGDATQSIPRSRVWQDGSHGAQPEFRADPRGQAPRSVNPGPPPQAPRIERAPVQSAPPPHVQSAPHVESHHSAPPPNRGRPDR